MGRISEALWAAAAVLGVATLITHFTYSSAADRLYLFTDPPGWLAAANVGRWVLVLLTVLCGVLALVLAAPPSREDMVERDQREWRAKQG